MGSGYDFENSFKHDLQEAFPSAYVHRFKQSKRGGQDWDLAIIRNGRPVFIECKSRNVSKRRTWTLETLFRPGQLENQLAITQRTNIDSYLAFEMRRGRGKSKQAVLIDLEQVPGAKLNLETLDIGVEIKRDGTQYRAPEVLENERE